MMSIIQPRGNGDVLDWCQYVGSIAEDSVGAIDAYEEYGAEMEEAIFQEEARYALLCAFQTIVEGKPIIASSEAISEDSETLAEEEAEWGASWMNDAPCRRSETREVRDSRMNNCDAD